MPFGADSIFRGSENDVLDGGDGNDFLNGQAGDDTANGSTGDDTALGGGGRDSLLDGDGDDILNGQSGNDTILDDYAGFITGDPVTQRTGPLFLETPRVDLLKELGCLVTTDVNLAQRADIDQPGPGANTLGLGQDAFLPGLPQSRQLPPTLGAAMPSTLLRLLAVLPQVGLPRRICCHYRRRRRRRHSAPKSAFLQLAFAWRVRE